MAVVAHPLHPINRRGRGARPLSCLIPDLPLDAIEVVNNAGFFSASGLTRFDGDRADDLRRALLAGRTRAQARRRWTADKAPRHVAFQVRAGLRFLGLTRRGIRPGLQPRAARMIVADALRLHRRSVPMRG